MAKTMFFFGFFLITNHLGRLSSDHPSDCLRQRVGAIHVQPGRLRCFVREKNAKHLGFLFHLKVSLRLVVFECGLWMWSLEFFWVSSVFLMLQGDLALGVAWNMKSHVSNRATVWVMQLKRRFYCPVKKLLDKNSILCLLAFHPKALSYSYIILLHLDILPFFWYPPFWDKIISKTYTAFHSTGSFFQPKLVPLTLPYLLTHRKNSRKKTRKALILP